MDKQPLDVENLSRFEILKRTIAITNEVISRTMNLFYFPEKNKCTFLHEPLL